LNTREVQQALRDLGWPIGVDGAFGNQTFDAVRAFQLGFAFWNLNVDGWAGPGTHDALRFSLGQGGKLSAHFKAREFKSKGNGWISTHRTLLRGLDKYRDIAGATRIESAYRDPRHNASIGGARNSQHLYGSAVDLPPRLSVATVRRLRLFSGIGYQRATGLVVHVDIRGIDGVPQTTAGATRDRPMEWTYPR
jgi:zinc D-Ala-D-Ala carboxypeptidase